MTVLADVDYPDIHDVLIAYVEPRLAADPAVDGQPVVDTNKPEVIPPAGALRVRRVGGNDDGTTDYPRVEVITYHHSFDAARALGERARQHLLVLGGQGVDNVAGHDRPILVDRSRTDTPPEPAYYENPDVDSWPAFYRFELRRPSRRGRA